MKKLILASANKYKIKEFAALLQGYQLFSLTDIGFFDDIAETGSTSAENAHIKAVAVKSYCDKNGVDGAVIADDTGLYVNALGGEPGIMSARYAGNHDDEANRQKLLKNLENELDRTAYFETVICMMDDDKIEYFYGRTTGHITTEKIGSDAFGYDCVFHSDDLQKTFGQASEEEKDSVSHRGRAVQELKAFLDGE